MSSSSPEKQSVNDENSTSATTESNGGSNSSNDGKSSIKTAVAVNEENSVLMDIVKEHVERTYVRIERNRKNRNQLLYVTKQSHENWIKGTIEPPCSQTSESGMTQRARECLMRSSLTKEFIPEEIEAINLGNQDTGKRKKQKRKRKNRRAKTEIKSYDEILDRYETQELVKTINLDSKLMETNDKEADRLEDKIERQSMYITPNEQLIFSAYIEKDKVDTAVFPKKTIKESVKSPLIDPFKTTSGSELSDIDEDEKSESSLVLTVPDDLVECLREYLEQLESKSYLQQNQQQSSSKPYSLYVTPTGIQHSSKQLKTLPTVPLPKTPNKQSTTHSLGFKPAPSLSKDDSIKSERYDTIEDDSNQVENYNFEKSNDRSPITEEESPFFSTMINESKTSSYKSNFQTAMSKSKKSVKQEEESALEVQSSSSSAASATQQPDLALTNESSNKQQQPKLSEDYYESIKTSLVDKVIKEQQKSYKIGMSPEESFKSASSSSIDESDADESSTALEVDPSLSRMILESMVEPKGPTKLAEQPKSLPSGVEKYNIDVIKEQQQDIEVKDDVSTQTNLQQSDQKIFAADTTIIDNDKEQLENLQRPLPTPKSSPLNSLSKSIMISPKPKSSIKTQSSVNENEIIANKRLISSLITDESEIKSVSKKPATLKFSVTPPPLKSFDDRATMKSPPAKTILNIESKVKTTETTSTENLEQLKKSTEKKLSLKSNEKRIASIDTAIVTPTSLSNSSAIASPSIIDQPIMKQSKDDKSMTVTIDDINSNRSIQMEIEPLETKTVIITSSSSASGEEDVMVEAELLSPVSQKEETDQYYLIRASPKTLMPLEKLSSASNDNQQDAAEAKTIQLSPSFPKSSCSSKLMEHKSLPKSLQKKFDSSPSIIIDKPKTLRFETNSNEFKSSPIRQPIVESHDSTKYEMINKLNQICDDDNNSKMNKLSSPASKRKLYRKKLVSNVTTEQAPKTVTLTRLHTLQNLLSKAKIKQTPKIDLIDQQLSESKSFQSKEQHQKIQSDKKVDDEIFRQKMVDFYIEEEEFTSTSEDLVNLELEFEKLPPPPPVVEYLTIESKEEQQRKQLQEELEANRKRLFNQIEQLKHRQKLHLANLYRLRHILETSKAKQTKQQLPKPNEKSNDLILVKRPLLNNDNFLAMVTVAGAATIAAVIATLLAIKFMY
uniref:Protein bir1-like isoform X1 n=1 Tax=Dermatophagoides pteronyssinus TaxID=6956 RepID=A0A6P6XXE6_DERPT|nr:protein bir1-like isoform X1 [Dermatophagoides pteronyssinus]